MVTLKAFFAEAREGRLIGICCLRCGELTVPPKEYCESCHDHNWEPVPLSGHGVITSFTIRQEKTASADVPYAVALVRLNESVTLYGRLVDLPLESVSIGTEVRFRPIISGDQILVAFGPRAS